MPPKNNPPKRHHFIPQMMLRHFADDDGQLWFWRREFEKGAVKKTGTKLLFAENDLYTLVDADGGKDVALETFFAMIEGIGARFIDDLADIIRAGETPKLDGGAWDFWGDFFYYHLKRTPGAIDAFAEQMDFDAKIEETFAKVQEARGKSGRDPAEPGLKERIYKNAVVMAQRMPPGEEVRKAFREFGLAVYRIIDPKKSFVVGDVPGAMARFSLSGGGMSHETMFLPLTWDIAVGHLTHSRKVEILIVDRDQVRRMNVASASRSKIIAGRSEALIRSLSLDVPYTGVVPR